MIYNVNASWIELHLRIWLMSHVMMKCMSDQLSSIIANFGQMFGFLIYSESSPSEDWVGCYRSCLPLPEGWILSQKLTLLFKYPCGFLIMLSFKWNSIDLFVWNDGHVLWWTLLLFCIIEALECFLVLST